MRKVTETDSHIFFVNGPLSNWHMAKFAGMLIAPSDVSDPLKWSPGTFLEFNCGEQYMMAAKASLFGDQETLEKIMETPDPKTQKELGRQVKGFDPVIWNQNARDIVFRGSWFRLWGNPNDYIDAILKSKNKILVEGAIYDPIWGVGLAWDDPKILDPLNWKGTNWLGEVHMEIRYFLRRQIEINSYNPKMYFDPWSKKFHIDKE